MKVSVINYALQFNPYAEQGRIVLHLVNGRTVDIDFEGNGAGGRFSACASILEQSPVFWNGTFIYSEWEPVIDEE